MQKLMKKLKRTLLCLGLASILCFSQGAAAADAASYEVDGCIIEDGFVPPEHETIVHHQNNSSKPYTKIANAAAKLWVGEHHRFTVVENRRKDVKIRWYSSNPEVASIDKVTGELTAYSAGTTIITMRDSVNKASQKCELTVMPTPVLPEMPAEWYTVEDYILDLKKEGIQLVLKPEYRYLYEQCSMLKIPEQINGKRVVQLRMDGFPGYSRFPDWGFTQLKIVQCTQDVAYQANGQAGIVCPADLKLLNFCVKGMPIPESVDLIVSDEALYSEQGMIRIPAGVKLICHNDIFSDGWGVYRGKPVFFAVDGNNTNFYSIFGILFAYPYHEVKEDKRTTKIKTASCFVMESERNALLAYPAERNGSVYRVPDGIERIEAFAFSGAKYLKKIVLPDSVTEIGIYAFSDMENKVEITIPASVTIFEQGGYYEEDGPFHSSSRLSEDRTAQENITIITPKGSAAEAYAIEHGIKYQNE